MVNCSFFRPLSPKSAESESTCRYLPLVAKPPCGLTLLISLIGLWILSIAACARYLTLSCRRKIDRCEQRSHEQRDQSAEQIRNLQAMCQTLKWQLRDRQPAAGRADLLQLEVISEQLQTEIGDLESQKRAIRSELQEIANQHRQALSIWQMGEIDLKRANPDDLKALLKTSKSDILEALIAIESRPESGISHQVIWENDEVAILDSAPEVPYQDRVLRIWLRNHSAGSLCPNKPRAIIYPLKCPPLATDLTGEPIALEALNECVQIFCNWLDQHRAKTRAKLERVFSSV